MKNTSRTPEKIVIVILAGMTLALVVSIAFLAWVPPVSRDALTHHLAVLKIYLQQGGITELPEIIFSYYPMNIDFLYMIPLYFGNDILPKYIHFLFALFTAGLLFWFLKRRLNVPYALFGALFFLSMPIIVKLSITVYVDLGLIFFSAAALILLLIWTESLYKSKHLVLSAIFCGLALGTKYNGLVVLFLLTLFTPLLYLQAERGKPYAQSKAFGFAGLYMLVALIVFSPWMIRNMIWTANPIYPLYNRHFQSAPADDAEELSIDFKKKIDYQIGHWNHFAIRRIMFKESWGEIALIPIRIFFQGQDDKPQYFDGKLNPFLFILPFMGFVSVRRTPTSNTHDLKMLAIFIGLFMLIAFLRTSIRIRYIAPVIPPLVILSVFGLHNLADFLKVRSRLLVSRVLLSVVVLAAIGMNAHYVINQFRSVDPFSYISGKVGRDAYITSRRPEFPVLKYANQHLSGKHVILGLFMGNRSYYSDRKLVFDEKWFTQSIIMSSSVTDIQEDLQRKGYTHLLVNLDLVKQWSKTFDRPDQKKIAEFFNYRLRLLKQNQAYVLFEVVPTSQL